MLATAIPFHNSEEVDEEVCLSIHQLQLILLLLSAILPLSPRISSDSSSSFRPCISIISFQHSHYIPITTFPCHAVAKSWVLSCFLLANSAFQLSQTLPAPNVPPLLASREAFAAESVYSQKQPIPSVSAEE